MNIYNKRAQNEIEEYNEVSLHKKSYELKRNPLYGLGFAISGGVDNPATLTGDTSIIVSDVIKGGPAWNKLQVNDKLSKINSISMKNVTYTEAVAVLELAKVNVRVTVERKTGPRRKHVPIRGKSRSRERRQRSYSSERSQKSGSPSVNWRKLNDVSKQLLVQTSSRSNKAKIVHVPTVHLPVRTKPEKVILEKSQYSTESYGIQLGTRVIIQDVQPNSLADRQGLKKDDTILDINGIVCDNKSINQAVDLITSGSENELSLLVQRGDGGILAIPTAKTFI